MDWGLGWLFLWAVVAPPLAQNLLCLQHPPLAGKVDAVVQKRSYQQRQHFHLSYGWVRSLLRDIILHRYFRHLLLSRVTMLRTYRVHRADAVIPAVFVERCCVIVWQVSKCHEVIMPFKMILLWAFKLSEKYSPADFLKPRDQQAKAYTAIKTTA